MRTEQNKSIRRSALSGLTTPRGIATSMLFLIGTSGVAVAGLGQLRPLVECNNCAMGPNDKALVCGDPVFCNASTQGCVTETEDIDNDGRIDSVTNLCLRK